MRKKTALKKSDIYAIVDIQTARKKNLARLVTELVENNIVIIQLRDKKSPFPAVLTKARAIKKILARKALFIVNDYPALCLLAGADGVHLGQDDLPVTMARKVLGKDTIIGVSCHSIEQAKAAQRAGADYIGFGPLFATPTKREYAAIGARDIPRLKKIVTIPFFAIGGIDCARLRELKPYGIKRIAVCRPLCQSNNIKKTVQELRAHLH